MTKRGGKRPGAGRTPLPDGERKVPMAIKIDPELRRYLQTRQNATQAIEQAVRRSAEFRKWKSGK